MLPVTIIKTIIKIKKSIIEMYIKLVLESVFLIQR